MCTRKGYLRNNVLLGVDGASSAEFVRNKCHVAQKVHPG